MRFEQTYIDRIIRQVINEQILLTEGDSRINAVYRIIEDKFKDLPLDDTVSSPEHYVNGNPNTTWKEYLLFNLRHTFGLMDNQSMKYLPLAARLAYSNEVRFDRSNDNGVEIERLRRILQKLKQDDNLFQKVKADKNITYSDLYVMFKDEFKKEDDADDEQANSVDPSNSDYDIIEVRDYETAHYYGNYSCSSSKLCYTQSDRTWGDYKGEKGENRCYLCLRRGWEDIPEVATEGNPYDEYGTSMIFVFINPEGNISTSNCRWNHKNTGKYIGGVDNAFTKSLLARTVGVPFNSVFKPYSENELLLMGYIRFDAVDGLLERGYSPGNIFDYIEKGKNGLSRVYLNGKSNLFSFKENRLLCHRWYDAFYDFENGYARVCLIDESGNTKWNFVDRSGNELCHRWYDGSFNFSNGYAIVALKDENGNYKCNFIDENGNELCNRWYDWIADFYDGYARVALRGEDRNYKYNLIDENGNELCNRWYDAVRNFENGYAIVGLKDKNGRMKYFYIDKNGNELHNRPL